jgi:hypothetical protein
VYVDEKAQLGAVGMPSTKANHAAVTLSGRMADVAAIDAAVRSGAVVLEPEAGERLLNTLRRQADAAEDWINRLRGMARPVPLGSNWVSHAMSGKFERRADGEDVSFLPVLVRYHSMLRDAHEVVDEAMRRYQTNEEGSARLMRRTGTTL